METVVPLGGTAVDDIRQVCSDSEMSDDGSSSGGGGGLRPLRSSPLCVVHGWMTLIVLYLVVFRTSWRRGEKYLSGLRHVDEVLPDVSPVVFARAAAVPLSLPTVAEVVSSAVFAEEVAPAAAPLAEVETVIVGMISLMEAGSELPVELLNSEHVTQDCLSVDVRVVVPELSPVVSARAVAVPMSLPAIAEVVSSAVFAGGGGGGVVADAAPMADVGTVTVGVSVLTDAGSELPADFAGVAAVQVAPLVEAGEVTLDVVGLDVGE